MFIIYNPDTNTAQQYYGNSPAKHCEAILKKDKSRTASHLLICKPILAARMHEGEFQMGKIEEVEEH